MTAPDGLNCNEQIDGTVIHTMMNKKLTMGILTVMLACAFMIAAVPSEDTEAAPGDVYTVKYIVGGDIYVKTYTDFPITLATNPTVVNAPEPVGKTFDKWYLNGTSVDKLYIENFTDNVCQVEAKYTMTIYKVTFNANGWSGAAKEYLYDATVTAPAVKTDTVAGYVVPAGYVFAGWSNGTSVFTDIPKVTANVTYAAVFEEAMHTVTYKLDGAVYSTQKVLAVADAVAPYIVGYTWGEAATVGYQTVIDAIPVPPAPTVTVKYFKGTEVYSVQVVPAAVNAIDPYVAGYTWGEKVKVDDANYTVTAIAIPRAADNSFGIDNFTLAVIVIVLIAVIGIVLYVAYEQGFLPVGKNKVIGAAKK